MVELQVLSKVLNDKSVSILELNNITPDYFITYPDEYQFIMEHYQKYGNVPDKETFIHKFPDFSIVSVSETDEYLINTFNEEYLYSKAVPVVQKIAELMQTDANAAVEYLNSQLDTLQVKSAVKGVDIISSARKRYDEWKEMKEHPEIYSISTGFDQLDDITGGWHRGEELVVIFARTGQGKSWVLIKTLEHAWRQGYRVGLIEPEMSGSKTGYRFDTLYGHMSNRSMVRGEEIPEYEQYISDLEKNKTPFFVAHPKEFARKVTVQKLKSFVKTNNLDILGIDGISYLTDQRARRGDSVTAQLTNISEDLMDMSIELGIPILVVVQSNREGAKEDKAPGLESIRDSDGIAYNASVVVSMRQKDARAELCVQKNRNGVTGTKLNYLWDIDKGVFNYVENDEVDDTESSKSEDTPPWEEKKSAKKNTGTDYKDATEVF